MPTNITRNLRKDASVLRAGYTLVAFSLALVLIVGSAGLAIDFGRMYITRSEAQSYCDSAAIRAAIKLDGSTAGIANARAAALAVTKGWQFGTTSFDPAATEVDFAKAVAGPYEANPSPADGYICARVRTRATLPLYLLPVAVGSYTSTIAANAVAQQIELTSPGPGHYAPFTPFGAPIMEPRIPQSGAGDPEPIYWNDPFNMKAAQEDNDIPAVHGGIYNIFWPNDTQLKNNWQNSDYACDDVQYPALLSLATPPAGIGNSNRGYIYGASNIVDATIIAGVLPDGQASPQTGQDILPMLGDSSGVMAANLGGALGDRVMTDTDSTSQWYADYHGNGARVMLMPINAGYCGPTQLEFQGKDPVTAYVGRNTCTFPAADGTTTNTKTYTSFEVIGWGRFFLREASYYSHIIGNRGVCAEYIGPGMVEGGSKGTGNSIYSVKLVQ